MEQVWLFECTVTRPWLLPDFSQRGKSTNFETTDIDPS